MQKTLSAREAAAILGISLATLYSYVSRGLLASSGDSGTRSKRYAQAEVVRLAARRGDGKRAGHAVSAAMSWGVPVLETRLSHVDGGRLYYRGQDACALAESATLEQAAALLWQPWLASTTEGAANGQGPGPRSALKMALPPPALSALLAAAAPLAPIPRAMALLPVLAERSMPPLALLRLAARLLLGTSDAGDAESETPLHLLAARAWRVDAAAEVLRAAMVVLADHELNNSTFTVRCAASSGADLPAVLCAGLAALSGTEHGGHYLIAKDILLREAAAPGTVEIEAITPGFGHPLYPNGDMRAKYLLGKLQAYDNVGYEPYAALAARAATVPGAHANSDFALAAMELVLGLPDGAALALLAMARTAGWIAHALEQRDDSRMMRPRARYVGDFG